MKKSLIIIILMAGACSPSATPPADPITPIYPTTLMPAALMSKWVLTDTQTAGTGPAGTWSAASPAGRTMELKSNGVIDGGAVFPSATGYQEIDSATIKIMDRSQPAGFRLFNYNLDTVKKALFFYIRPPNGGYCYEGCGTLKFSPLAGGK